MKPPFAYFGGKQRLADRIVRLLPPHQVYIEPFAGSAAVLFAKSPSPVEIINDRDGGVVAFFRVLRDNPEELARVCALTPYARDEHAACLDIDSAGSDIEKARRFWVQVNQTFSKATGNKGWSISTACRPSSPVTVASRIEDFMLCADRLRGVFIENCDAVDLIDRLATREDTVVYVDPPYLKDTRSRGSGGDYRFDMPDEAAHRRLAEALHATSAVVVLSGYPSELYDELYGDWFVQDFDVVMSSSNSRTRTRSTRVEKIWMNRRPLQASLFDQAA